MKLLKKINPNIKWVGGVFAIIGILLFSAGYTFKRHLATNETKVIVKILKINGSDTTIIEKEYNSLEGFHKPKKE
ncbi:MAG TPA: hypothetical protein EYN89_03180 [Flavobacteriales bacterium]|nr:hypothetical protein [Flavobacteriales bacterium]